LKALAYLLGVFVCEVALGILEAEGAEQNRAVG
jgi:hypothetical protein